LKTFAKDIASVKQKHKGKGKRKSKDQDQLDDNVDVFDIQFAFRNHKLINLLKLRGLAITYLDFDKVRDCEDKIAALVSSENHSKDKDMLVQPVCAFVTFRSDDHKTLAMMYSEKAKDYQNSTTLNFTKKDVFNGIDTKFKDSTQPTNIIWENRHIKGVDYGGRVMGAFLIILVMLTITFWIIYSFKIA